MLKNPFHIDFSVRAVDAKIMSVVPLAATRLQPRGYGDTKPSAPNGSENNKKKNRRVELVVLKL